MSTAAERKAVYCTPQWRSVRADTLRRASHQCERCAAQGRRRPAALVHHCTPIRAGGHPFAPSNVMAVCKPCHEALHEALEEKPVDAERVAWNTLIQTLVTENRT